jgi:hypothetical protein
LLDRARRERERAQRAKPLELEVPGNETVVVRYRPLPWEDAHRLLTSTADGAESALRNNLDALVAGCDELLLRADDGTLVPLARALRDQGVDLGEPDPNVVGKVRFDEHAVNALGLHPAEPTAQATVLALFSGAVSPEFAIGQHAGVLADWIARASPEVDAEVAGGSERSPSPGSSLSASPSASTSPDSSGPA